MIKTSLLAAALAAPLATSVGAGIYVPPKPAIVKPENIEFSKHLLLLGMPLTMGMLASAAGPAVTVLNRIATPFTNTSALTTYTATAQAIGDASSTRRVIVYASGQSGTNARTVSTVTIGGISATIDSQITASSGGSTVGCIASATVPTGTTANVVVTFNGSMIGCTVLTIAIDNLQNTAPHSTGSSTALSGTAISTAVDWLSGGFVVGAVSEGNTTYTWTGITERYDYSYTLSGFGRRTSLADDVKASTATSQTVTATSSASMTRGVLNVVSYR